LTVDGILNVRKPKDWSSLDVVRVVRRHSGVRRVGHAGTLDPAAEGVLPVCLGQATRLTEYLLDTPKSYRACIRLGIVTDTYDAAGTVVREDDPAAVTQAMVERLLPSFSGEIDQVPPMFSALKRDGVPLYRYARAGQTVERAPRPVRIYGIELVEFQPPTFTIEVKCGRGVYLRTLAYDLGEGLGCGAHLEHLVRLAVGPFSLEAAVGMEELREAFLAGTWGDLLCPLDSVLLSWQAAILGDDSRQSACLGRAVELIPLRREGPLSLAEGALCRAYSLDGLLVALLRYQGGGSRWRPEKVFLSPK
jgi:tRNA pseudouridine55 synthase